MTGRELLDELLKLTQSELELPCYVSDGRDGLTDDLYGCSVRDTADFNPDNTFGNILNEESDKVIMFYKG